jgi:hypothetical protein
MYELQPQDFIDSSDRTVDEQLRLGVWRVYERYDIIEVEGRRYVYAPDSGSVTNKVKERFRPLSRRTAGLFLDFARWPEWESMDKALDTERNAEAAKLWAGYNGVLGLNLAGDYILDPIVSKRVTADFLGVRLGGEMVRGRRNSDRGGGPNESVDNFAFEAWEARTVLRLYEAVINPNGMNLDTMRSFMSPYEQGELSFPGASWNERDIYGRDPEQARRWAWHVIEGAVQRKVENECYPTLQGAPGSYRQGWGFKSLLGAMWLQMMWLMLDKPRQCLWCGKIIDVDEFEQEDDIYWQLGDERRRTRSDKKFCDNNGRCRAKWNYHRGSGKSSKQARKRARRSNTD